MPLLSAFWDSKDGAEVYSTAAGVAYAWLLVRLCSFYLAYTKITVGRTPPQLPCQMRREVFVKWVAEFFFTRTTSSSWESGVVHFLKRREYKFLNIIIANAVPTAKQRPE